VYRSIQIQESCVEVAGAVGLLSQAALRKQVELSPSSLSLLSTIFAFTRLTVQMFHNFLLNIIMLTGAVTRIHGGTTSPTKASGLPCMKDMDIQRLGSELHEFT
jgi:hypothetical protein